MATYEIWTLAPHTGDKRELVNTYFNRGHAVAKLRGLRRKAWLYRSEMAYALVENR